MARFRGNVVDVQSRRIHPAELVVEDGRIAAIAPLDAPQPTFLLPGFVDAHIHVESSMLPPSEFGRAALSHGTVAVVADPHEIANVLGIEGVRYMIEDGERSPLKFSFGAPSCVPASDFETAGARFGAAEVEALFEDPRVSHLGEVMNFPAVINGAPDCMAILEAARARGLPIDGHAPGLMGEGLEAYARAGVQTDHECCTIEEGRARIALGMWTLIREGSAAQDFEALCPLIDERPERCMLASDDKHPDDLLKGHINQLVRRAVARGLKLMNVLQVACLNPVLHYGLDVGLLQVGDPADFVEVDSLERFEVLRTVIDGEVVFERGAPERPKVQVRCPNVFAATPKRPEDFALLARPGRMLAIGAKDRQLLTERLVVEPRVEAGLVEPDLQRDLLLLSVVNRYIDQSPAVGLIQGFGLQRGALASSVAHDSHNIIAVGTSRANLARAVNRVIACQGAICAVDEEEAREEALPLPIAGLMSFEEHRAVARAYEAVTASARRMGCALRAPFMTLSFMALLVIPRLKLGDRGLFDTERFSLVSPFVEGLSAVELGSSR